MSYELVLAALADPTRRTILERLREQPSSVGLIADTLPVSRPAVSQHLRVLKQAGLVREKAEGTRRVYRAEPSGLVELKQYLDTLWDDVLESFRADAEKEEEGG